MDIQKFKKLLVKHEGSENTAYEDTNKHITVGVGFNMDRSGAREFLEDLGIDYNAVRAKKQKLTDKQIDDLLSLDAAEAITIARNFVKNFDTIAEARQLVLADMAFNLGEGTLGQFKKLKAAVEAGNWKQAASEMANSRWHEQTKSRGVEDVAMMLSGECPAYLGQ